MAGELSHPHAPSHLRSDAQENRDRVLAAARELFAADGLEVTMRQVARRAGVGPATLYRRFPTKQALMAEAFKDEVEACGRIVREAAADPDPWRGFRAALENLLLLGGRNRGFTDAYIGAYAGEFDLAGHRAELLAQLASLAARAKQTGRLRADFTPGDFVLLLRAGRGLATGPPAQDAQHARAAHRLTAILLEGVAARSQGATRSPRAGSGRPAAG